MPRGAAELTQSLVAARDGFSAVDLLAVVNRDNPPADVLMLRVRDAGERLCQAPGARVC